MHTLQCTVHTWTPTKQYKIICCVGRQTIFFLMRAHFFLNRSRRKQFFYVIIKAKTPLTIELLQLFTISAFSLWIDNCMRYTQDKKGEGERNTQKFLRKIVWLIQQLDFFFLSKDHFIYSFIYFIIVLKNRKKICLDSQNEDL